MHFTGYGATQGDIRGGSVFDIRRAPIRMKDATLPKKTRKACIFKDITRLFQSDALKTLGTVWRYVLLCLNAALFNKNADVLKASFRQKQKKQTMSPCHWRGNVVFVQPWMCRCLMRLLDDSPSGLAVREEEHHAAHKEFCMLPLCHDWDHVSEEGRVVVNARRAGGAVFTGLINSPRSHGEQSGIHAFHWTSTPITSLILAP